MPVRGVRINQHKPAVALVGDTLQSIIACSSLRLGDIGRYDDEPAVVRVDVGEDGVELLRAGVDEDPVYQLTNGARGRIGPGLLTRSCRRAANGTGWVMRCSRRAAK